MTTDALGHAVTAAHWRELPAAVDQDEQVTVLARVFAAGRSGMDLELAAYFPQDDPAEAFLHDCAIGDVLHAAVTGALTQYLRVVVVSTRDGRYMLPVALIGQWIANAQATVYYARMVDQRRLQRLPAAWVWESDQFTGRGRMTDPSTLRVSRHSPPSPLLAPS